MSNIARSCGWCGADISDMRANAKYCCRSHKVQAGVRRHQERKAGDHREYWRQYRAERKPDDWVDGRIRPVNDEKRCPRCDEVKSISEFGWNVQRDRPQGRCRACHGRDSARRTRERRGLPEDAPLTSANLDARQVGDTTLDSAGYVMVKMPDHHRAWASGYVYQHILVAEQKYDIKITREFTIHHRNADRADNRPRTWSCA